jgi:tetratricopeptide (TPR) repeat protein
MLRAFSPVLAGAVCGWLLTATPAARADDDFAKDIDQLNKLTGNAPMAGALKELQSDPARAKKLLAGALPLAKDSEKLTFNGAMVLALAAADLKDFKSSEAYFRTCIDHAVKLQSAEKLLEAYSPLIGIYFDNKQYDQTIRICKELLELQTDDGKERVVLVPFENKRGEIFFEEFDRFDTAGRLRPGVHKIYIEAVTKSGDFKQALKLVDNLIKAQDDWRDRQLKVWVLREAGRDDEAIKVYEEIIAAIAKDKNLKEPDRDKLIDRSHYALSNIYLDMKKVDKATDILQQLVKKKPDHPGYNNDLGYIWADNDMNLEEAEKLIRKALDLDADLRAKLRAAETLAPEDDHENGAYLDSLAWVLFKKKQYKEAKDILLKAVEDKDSQHIEIYDHLGDVYLALGERQKAVEAWRKGLEVVGDGRREAERKSIVEKKIEKNKK